MILAFVGNAFFQLERKPPELFVALFGGGILTGLGTWAMYLRLTLGSYGVVDVSLYDLASIREAST